VSPVTNSPSRPIPPPGQVICGPERSHPQVDPPRKPARDFLEQPNIAVGIAEQGPRAIAPPLRIKAGDKTLRAEAYIRTSIASHPLSCSGISC